jgi:hypothetical protein
MSSSPVPNPPHADPSPKQARDVRARAWAFVFNCHGQKNKANASPASRTDDAVWKNAEGVSHVDQRPD